MSDGSEECGGGAAGFDGVGVGFEDGFEGSDAGLAEGLVVLGFVEGEVGGDVGTGGPAVEGDEVFLRGEFGGEGSEVEVEGEEAEEAGGVF